MPHGCDAKILTIDLRTTCSPGVLVLVFDVILYSAETTPGSGLGRLTVSGGTCQNPVPVLLYYNVGVGGNDPLPDLWKTAKFYFGAAGCCSLATDVSIDIDTDTVCIVDDVANCHQVLPQPQRLQLPDEWEITRWWSHAHDSIWY